MLAIGPVQFDLPVVQAALSGYSDAAMRRLAREYGCPYALNEVVLDRLVADGGRQTRRMLALTPDDHPVGGQLMGSRPEQFAEAAHELVELGYDVIDVNFACPVKKALGKQRGGYLLSTPDRARQILERVCDAVGSRVPVTVKMRRGMDLKPQSRRDFFAILDAALEIGVAAVTVHGRTVEQRYVGPSDWSFLAEVKQHVGDRILLGSGDLFCAEDCVRMMERTGVDGCSIARGAIGNPFIFQEVGERLSGRPLPAPPSIAAQRRAIERHLDLMRWVYGDDRAPRLFRKFGVSYSELHPCSHDVKMAFVAVNTLGDFHTLLQRWYGDADAHPPVTRRARPEALVAAGATMQDCGQVS